MNRKDEVQKGVETLQGKRKTQKDSGAEQVRAILHEMPERFSVLDVKARLPDIAHSTASAALRWCLQYGFIKRLGRASYVEHRAVGRAGAPPVIYGYVGSKGEIPKPKRGRPRKSQSGMGQSETSNTELMEVPVPVVDVPSFTEEVVQIDKSPEVLKSLTNALLLVQVAQVLQDMPIEQALQMVGTMRQLGNLPVRRR